MLFLSGESAYPKRVQGVYISEKEVQRVVKFIKGDQPVEYKEEVLAPNFKEASVPGLRVSSSDITDPLYEGLCPCCPAFRYVGRKWYYWST